MRLTACSPSDRQNASALICALGTIVVLSIVGAGVLMNCTTRYNSTSKQVKGWKEALYAAEAGGDVAYNAIRLCNGELAADPNATCASSFPSASGWASPAPAPITASDSRSLGYGSTFTLGTDNSLSAKVTVDKFGGTDQAPYYRIRSIGTAQVSGLKRVGMDNRVGTATKGDSLLRKLDFNFDHFIATYGFGDALATAAATSGNGKGATAVMSANMAQVTRRIELVAIPVMPIEGAIKTRNSFRGGRQVDSYDSQFGAYQAVDALNPTAYPYNENARDGDVACGSAIFDCKAVYGDVTTNGGNAGSSPSQTISGVIDNAVAFALPTATPGVAPIPLVDSPNPTPGATWEPGSVLTGATVTPPARIPMTGPAPGVLQTTFWYQGPSMNGVTVNPVKPTLNGNTPVTPVDTVVNLYASTASGTASTGLTVNKGASVNFYFRGDILGAATAFNNNNADGPVVPWQYFYATTTDRDSASGFSSSKDLNKVAYVDGNPGTYWRIAAVDATMKASWVSYPVSNTTSPYSPFDVLGKPIVVCAFVPPKWSSNNAPGTSITYTDASGNALKYKTTDVGEFYFQQGGGAGAGTYSQLMSLLTDVPGTPTGSLTPVWDKKSLPLRASNNVSKAGHNWFYGISPPAGSSRSINITPSQDFYAAIYAPDHDFSDNGNVATYGVMVAKSFSQNGICQFHFDKQLASNGPPLDYRIASYIEDIR